MGTWKISIENRISQGNVFWESNRRKFHSDGYPMETLIELFPTNFLTGSPIIASNVKSDGLGH